jgi:hypothetical protein
MAGTAGCVGDAGQDVEVAPEMAGGAWEGGSKGDANPLTEARCPGITGASGHFLLRAAATSDILNRHVLRTRPVRG